MSDKILHSFGFGTNPLTGIVWPHTQSNFGIELLPINNDYFGDISTLPLHSGKDTCEVRRY